MGDEEIIEQRERGIHRAVDAGRKAQTEALHALARIAPAIAVAGLVFAAVLGRTGAGRVTLLASPTPSPAPVVVPEQLLESPSPSPSPEPSLSPVASFYGEGPLVFFSRSHSDGERSGIYYIDASWTEGDVTFETQIANYAGELEGNVAPYEQWNPSLMLISVRPPTGNTQVWTFRRGVRPDSPAIDEGVDITGVLSSPDGKLLAVTRDDVADPNVESLWLYSAQGRPLKPLMEVHPLKDEIGVPRPFAWSGNELIGQALCACDAPQPSALYAFSLARRTMSRARWLGTPALDSNYSSSADGSRFVFSRETPKECTPTDEEGFGDCYGPPTRLLLADVRKHQLREIARTSETTFLHPALSADGRLVAYGSGFQSEIIFREVSSGKIVSRAQAPLLDFQPIAWVGPNLIVAQGATGAIGAEDSRSQRALILIRLVRGERFAGTQELLKLGDDMEYLGWLK